MKNFSTFRRNSRTSAFQVAILCNNAVINDGEKLLGQPTEGALLFAAMKVSILFLCRYLYHFFVLKLTIMFAVFVTQFIGSIRQVARDTIQFRTETHDRKMRSQR